MLEKRREATSVLPAAPRALWCAVKEVPGCAVGAEDLPGREWLCLRCKSLAWAAQRGG